MLKIKPVKLYFSGIKISDELNHLTEDEERIIEAFCGVNFEYPDEIRDAFRGLRGIDPAKIIECISKYWETELVLVGLKNLEDFFKIELDPRDYIKNYFAEDDHWAFRRNKEGEWLKKFEELSGCRINANDVVEHIDVDYILNSDSIGLGLGGFFVWVIHAGGDPKLVIKKFAPEVEKFSHENVEDVVFFMDDYLEKGDFDFERLLKKTNWYSVRRAGCERAFSSFFERYLEAKIF